MRVKLLTLRYSPTLGVIDDTPLAEFTRDKEVISIRDHFFLVNDIAHVACIVSWQEPMIPPQLLAQAVQSQPAAGQSHNGSSSRDRYGRDRPDPALGLNEQDRLLFNTVRQWRSKKAREEGAPPYVILTNRELLAVIAAKPENLTALSQLDGIGKAKIERYGREILARLHGAHRTAAPATEPPVVAGALP
jgi:ATP-dependent DNA helicase RecQ